MTRAARGVATSRLALNCPDPIQVAGRKRTSSFERTSSGEKGKAPRGEGHAGLTGSIGWGAECGARL